MTANSKESNKFCDQCDVSLDLHPSEGQSDEEWECDVARMRADMIDRFGFFITYERR